MRSRGVRFLVLEYRFSVVLRVTDSYFYHVLDILIIGWDELDSFRSVTWLSRDFHSGFLDVLLKWRAFLLFEGYSRFVVELGIVVGVAVKVGVMEVGFRGGTFW